MTENKRIFLTGTEANHPTYRACNNQMRSKAEQYEILTNPPEKFYAYIGQEKGMTGLYFEVTTWVGDKLGTARRGQGWKVKSYVGKIMYQFYANVAGREYTGRSLGNGMGIALRETAASKRKRANQYERI